ncbi:MAG: hypothetical protein EXR58_04930 [Chloroflexi bacterium]|nr:hypothetical protein [Chloroflexota bacterium]
MKEFLNRHSSASGLLLITLIGGLLRFWNLDAAQFSYDEWHVTSLALQIARQGFLPTDGGASSVGINNGPAGDYLIAIPALFSTSHWAMAGFVAALNTAAIPIFYWVAAALFGPRAGLVAALLFATNPWLVVTGRRLWLNALLAPGAVVFLWAVYRAAVHNTWATWTLAGAALATSVQIHLSAVPNALALVGLAPIARRSWAGIAFAVLVAGLLMAPWVTQSLLPDLARSHLTEALGGATSPSSEVVERLTRPMTGLGYQAVAAQAARMLDADSPPFTAIDVLGRSLAVIGALSLGWLGWARRDQPAIAALCLVAFAMVAIPALILAWPPRTGSLPFAGPHHLINVIPPFMLGIAGLTVARFRLIRVVAEVSCLLVASSQLALAVPFFTTVDEYWMQGDYGIPWHFTGELVDTVRNRAATHGESVYVGGIGSNVSLFGEAEQQNLTEWLLRRDYDLARAHDSRDGIVYRVDTAGSIFVTTNDRHSEARFLRTAFPNSQLLEQVLPGSGWIRRAFELAPRDIEAWASSHLSPVADPGSPVLRYERAALLPASLLGERPVLALLWEFKSDPVEAFFTDIVLFKNGFELFRETHLAYPAPFMETDDWKSLRVLNLFDLPDGLDVRDVTEVALIHNGLRSGRDITPALRFPVVAASR